MHQRKSFKMWTLFVPSIIIVLYLAGCAVKRAPLWGDPQTGLILTYRLPKGEVLKYKRSGEFSQYYEIMGQTVELSASDSAEFSVALKGEKNGNLLLSITIEAAEQSLVGPQGDLSPDVSPIVGRSFEMTISPLGKELELSGADSIRYQSPDGERSVEADFQDTFPDLADRPVKVGDTWKSTWGVNDVVGSSESKIDFESENTLEGFETVEGFECARIASKLKGYLQGQGEQQGVEVAIDGNIEGTFTWYFAYKEGIFVKMISEGMGDMTVTVPSQGFTIPVTREYSGEVKLIK
ncbi:MAG: hypothetical protein ACE5LC_08850 [Candidatus Aminicenantales bacterium]